MKIEIRNGAELHISGYVNAVERDSRVLPPEMAPEATSPFVEKVSAGAFKRAIERNPNVRLYYNHEREIGSVSGGQLRLKEDNIGLFADAVITDENVVAAAKSGGLKGWSFGFSGARSMWEPAGENLKRRKLTDFDLKEVSILTKTPAYFGTSVEMRGDQDQSWTFFASRCFGEEVCEIRYFEDAGTVPVTENQTENKENALDEGRFFIAQKQLELLKLKGEF